jgi:hypothetical protein
METKNTNKSLLNDFFTKIEKIPIDISEALLNSSSDEDEKLIIKSLVPVLTNQFAELTGFMREKTAKAPMEGVAQAEQFMKISSGSMLADNLKLSLPSIGSIVGKLGIDGIIKEIKKILKEIIRLFGINLPNWVDAILTLIDEIFNILFGGGSAKNKIMFSQIEERHLAELTQLAKLQKATKNISIQDEDDE